MFLAHRCSKCKKIVVDGETIVCYYCIKGTTNELTDDEIKLLNYRQTKINNRKQVSDLVFNDFVKYVIWCLVFMILLAQCDQR